MIQKTHNEWSLFVSLSLGVLCKGPGGPGAFYLPVPASHNPTLVTPTERSEFKIEMSHVANSGRDLTDTSNKKVGKQRCTITSLESVCHLLFTFSASIPITQTKRWPWSTVEVFVGGRGILCPSPATHSFSRVQQLTRFVFCHLRL